ncbi:MAG: SIMPL domain-containing protein [Pseudomonadota bacterium]
MKEMKALAALLIALLLGACGAVNADAPAGIQVSGQGTLEVAPDLGRLNLHARREGTEGPALKAELDAVVTAVLALTAELDIEARDVTATAVSMQPRYERRGDRSVVAGLAASRTITVVLRDLERFSELLDGSLALGINNLDPIALDSSRRAELEDEALDLAMADAEREAQRVADGFRVQLGPVNNVFVGSHSPRPQAYRAAAMAESTASSFSPGVIVIERSVQATFSIIP